jgi:hypothetical protein
MTQWRTGSTQREAEATAEAAEVTEDGDPGSGEEVVVEAAAAGLVVAKATANSALTE